MLHITRGINGGSSFAFFGTGWHWGAHNVGEKGRVEGGSYGVDMHATKEDWKNRTDKINNRGCCLHCAWCFCSGVGHRFSGFRGLFGVWMDGGRAPGGVWVDRRLDWTGLDPRGRTGNKEGRGGRLMGEDDYRFRYRYRYETGLDWTGLDWTGQDRHRIRG